VTRRATSILLLCAALAGLAGCGGGGKKEQTTAKGGPVRNVDPVPDESVGDVIDRIRGASTASGCEAVKGLLHSTYGDVSDASCRAIRAQIDGFQDPRGTAFKTGAAVSYRTATGRRRVIALALDADRTYRIAFIDDVPGQPIGTAKPGAFDRNARAVVKAMRDGDCDAFLTLVSRTDGLGVGPDEEVCRRVSDVPFRRELVGNPRAEPVPLGGNSAVAFYKLRTRPDAYYTMIMARDGSRYVLVTALPAD
jgi:hypothetical protein